jgi:hypothetical protein
MSEQQQPPSAPRRPLNEIRRTENVQGPPDRSMPESIKQHYHQDGNAFRSAYQPDKLEFVDRGSRMHAYNPVSTFTTRAMAEIADKRGWKEIEITGNAKFQQSMYVEAASRGIAVRGYEPTQKDAEVLQRRADRKDAASNPMVQAFTSAETDKDRKAAVKQYPALKEAFAVEAQARSFAEEKIDSKKAAQAFVDRTRDNIALALHRGQEIKLKTDLQQQAPATQRESDRDQGRSR